MVLENQSLRITSFNKERHVIFLQMMNQLLASGYQSQDINRLTLAYFVTCGLDILGTLDCDNFMAFKDPEVLVHNCSHLVSAYCALAILKTIGYDFSQIDSESILMSMRNLQQPDGRIGGVLRILGGHEFIDDKSLNGFLFTCQSEYGGFSKFPGDLPDLYPSFYGFAAFSLFGRTWAELTLC